MVSKLKQLKELYKTEIKKILVTETLCKLAQKKMTLYL